MASLGQVEQVKILLDAGADLHRKNPDGSTVLMQAAGWHASDAGPCSSDEQAIAILKLLLSKGADINEKDKAGDTALMYAARERDGLEVSFLVQSGARIDYRDRWGVTALMMIANRGKQDPGVQALLKRGAKVGPVEALLMRDKLTFFKLVDAGASLKGLGPGGENLLSIAAEQGDLELVKWLVDRGFDVNFTASDGATPLILAVAGSPVEEVFCLSLWRKWRSPRWRR